MRAPTHGVPWMRAPTHGVPWMRARRILAAVAGTIYNTHLFAGRDIKFGAVVSRFLATTLQATSLQLHNCIGCGGGGRGGGGRS